MVKLITRLTWDIVKNYSDRKEEGLIALIVNTNTGEIHLVPRDIEHVDFVCRLLDINKKELKKDPTIVSHIIPSMVIINQEREVVGVITGVSGLELGWGVRHTREALERVHSIIHKFIENGEVPIGRLERDDIIYKFARN